LQLAYKEGDPPFARQEPQELFHDPSKNTHHFLSAVSRLFHVYLMEEGARANNPAAQLSGGRAMIARFIRLPSIPHQEHWQSILAAARHESIRKRLILASHTMPGCAAGTLQ
jgi:site-specific recombinase XerD